MGAFLGKARELLEVEDISQLSEEERKRNRVAIYEGVIKEAQPGRRHVALITPGRMIVLIPAPQPNTKSEKELAPLKSLLPAKNNLQITAISYTKFEAYMQDKEKTRCIPFLGFLLGFAYLGHNVIVFEGHSSALEAGVRNSDVLLIDSGMMPFMQENWADVVFEAMKRNAKVFIHKRETYSLLPVARKKSPPGWQYSCPDGEASYVNVLFTTLAKGSGKTVRIIEGQALPSPAELTNDPDELEYISTLPFKYDKLNANQIIEIILNLSKSTWLDKLKSTRTLNAKLAESGDRARDVSFQLKLAKTKDGRSCR